MRLTAIMGIPGCGKSTFVEACIAANPNPYTTGRPTVVCPDEIRLQLTGDASNQDRNAEVFDIARSLADATLAQGRDVMWDATNVTTRARADILKLAKLYGATATLVVLDVPFEIASARNQARERVVPGEVLVRMFYQFQDALSEIGHEAWDGIEFERIG